mmetsp:Transcript_92415/g.298700  ORF Transcript_92415/g.298700 Transcript_92415/m.298700 type:complete len:213 (-) Transcript_92415:1635-2273(-)
MDIYPGAEKRDEGPSLSRQSLFTGEQALALAVFVAERLPHGHRLLESGMFLGHASLLDHGPRLLLDPIRHVGSRPHRRYAGDLRRGSFILGDHLLGVHQDGLGQAVLLRIFEHHGDRLGLLQRLVFGLATHGHCSLDLQVDRFGRLLGRLRLRFATGRNAHCIFLLDLECALQSIFCQNVAQYISASNDVGVVLIAQDVRSQVQQTAHCCRI